MTATTFNAGFYFLNSIDLKQPGSYAISFYSFIYCPIIDCDTDDSIILKLKEEDELDFRVVYSSGVTIGRVKDVGWVKDTVVFNTLNAKINVNLIFQKTVISVIPHIIRSAGY